MDTDKLYRYLEGTSSEQELLEIELWLDESEENRKSLAELKAIWVVSTLPCRQADIKNFRNCGEIVGDNAVSPDKKRRGIYIHPFIFYPAAAILLLMLIINAVALLYKPVESENRIAMSEISAEEICNIYTEKGTKATVSLPDGSKVWLNSDTRLSYPTKFPGDTREVNLSGEAYFEVVSDSLKPMIVTTQKGYMVKVLGTKFHIKSYENDSYSKVTLNSGKIKLIYPDGKSSGGCAEIGMSPNETVILGKVKAPKRVTQSIRTTSNDVAWKQGELIFDRTPMDEAIKMIERWHGAKFTITNNGLLAHKLTATFKTESLVQILEVIKMLTGTEYVIKDGNEVILK